MLAKSPLIRSISGSLEMLSGHIRNLNGIALTDENILSEDFFAGFLNRIYGYDLVNLNLEKLNYPGIDLGDNKKKLCVQVTSDNSKDKIQDSINKFNKHNLNEKYDLLIILIIGIKKAYRDNFEKGVLDFNPKEHILDNRDLIKKIRTLDTNALRELYDFLGMQVDKKLSISISLTKITEDDIRDLTHIIYEYVQANLEKNNNVAKQYVIGYRDDDFIVKKNKLNKVTDSLFNSEIRHNLIYQNQIECFFKNPINRESQKEYFVITSAIQKLYENNREEFSGIEDVFEKIYHEIISRLNYDNRNLNNTKALIMLHNMYFNCDIGNNPKLKEC